MTDLQQIIEKFGSIATLEKISGWGRYAFVDCVVIRPQTINELKAIVKICSLHGYCIAIKGSGCSFGDLITNTQGIVLDLTSWNNILDFNPETGVLKTQGGVSAGKTLHLTLAHHWMLRGLPGTSFGTMAGLIANNVHGKDSFKNGNFGTGVLAIKMLRADGEIIELSPDKNTEIFNAIIGGMGLLGIILEVTFQLVKIPGSMVLVEQKYFNSIPDLINLFSTIAKNVDMDAAWFDGFHKQQRGIFQTANFISQDPDPLPPSMEYVPKKFMGKFPIGLVYPLVKPFACRSAMSFLNKIAYWGSKYGEPKKILHLYNYYYPHMITIPDSPLAIRGGLVGFQLICPEASACDFIVKLLALCRRYKLETWFGGVKRLKADPFLVSFAEDGYAITIEVPGRFTKWAQFPDFVEKIVELTVFHQGKIFLGKDILLKPEHVRSMYPKLPKFLEIRQRLDPNRLFGSDHSRRLML